MARTICQKLIRHIPDWTVLHRPVELARVSGKWLGRFPVDDNPVSQDLRIRFLAEAIRIDRRKPAYRSKVD